MSSWRERARVRYARDGRVLELLAERGRVCATDLGADLGLSPGNAHNILFRLFRDGALTYEVEPSPQRNGLTRRYYRLAEPVQKAAS